MMNLQNSHTKKREAKSHITKKQVAAVGKINLLAQPDMLFLSPCSLQNEWTKISYM